MDLMSVTDSTSDSHSVISETSEVYASPCDSEDEIDSIASDDDFELVKVHLVACDRLIGDSCDSYGLTRIRHPRLPYSYSSWYSNSESVRRWRWPINHLIQFAFKTNWTIGTFKSYIGKRCSVKYEEQRFYANQLTPEQVTTAEELSDETHLSHLPGGVACVSLVIKSPSPICRLLKRRLRHFDRTHRKQLQTQFESIPIHHLDTDSIRESTTTSTCLDVTIRSSEGRCLDEIEIDGQIFVPYQVVEILNTKLVEFRGKYSYQYSVASDEYVNEVNKANEKYESDLAHCKKLLHELPIALANSQIKLVEETKAIREKKSGTEFADLGALVYEQSVIADEIKTQEERSSQLKPAMKFEKERFARYHVQSHISLKFGWHQFGSTTFGLFHNPMPTANEMTSMVQVSRNQISVKRTRQQFEPPATTAATSASAKKRKRVRHQ